MVESSTDDTASHLKSRVAEAVSEKQETAALGLRDLASVAKTAADDLKDRDQTQLAQVMRSLADGLEEFSRSFSRRNLGDMLSDMERFAKDRPMVLVGGAVLAGLAISRFAKSSSMVGEREHLRGVESSDRTRDRESPSPDVR